MDLFVYADESGVFDNVHNDYFVFGGLLFLSKQDRDLFSRKYKAAENNVRKSESIPASTEVKACNILPKNKKKLYRAVNSTERFCIVIDQKRLSSRVFSHKKTKQRYLDWAFKMSIKKKFMSMISSGSLEPKDVETITFLIDEHTTATNGWYELRESLEKEFKLGMWNFDYMIFYPPLFPSLTSINLQYCNSSKKVLVRAADIVANHIYYQATHDNGTVPEEDKLFIYYHP